MNLVLFSVRKKTMIQERKELTQAGVTVAIKGGGDGLVVVRFVAMAVVDADVDATAVAEVDDDAVVDDDGNAASLL